MSVPVLLLPGFGNSGPQHWQTYWGRRHPEWSRVDFGQWERPSCDNWVGVLERAVRTCVSPPVLVAHSLGCLVVAHWANRSSMPLTGAFLVAVPDPDSTSFPAAAQGFAPVPMQPFAFRSLVVSSSNDLVGSLAHARRCADAWKSRFVDMGPVGHINAESGLGAWEEGYRLFQQFTV